MRQNILDDWYRVSGKKQNNLVSFSFPPPPSGLLYWYLISSSHSQEIKKKIEWLMFKEVISSDLYKEITCFGVTSINTWFETFFFFNLEQRTWEKQWQYVELHTNRSNSETYIVSCFCKCWWWSNHTLTCLSSSLTTQGLQNSWWQRG